MKYYTAHRDRHRRRTAASVSRTGYTGEDGCEMIVPQPTALELWDKLLDRPRRRRRPAGLGARDTLRLEAGMPLYGHELSEDDQSVSGRARLCRESRRPRVPRPRRRSADRATNPSRRAASACELDGKRMPREGYRGLGAATSRWAKSPAARSRRRSIGRSRWRTSSPSCATTARSWRSTSAASANGVASCRCRFIDDRRKFRFPRHSFTERNHTVKPEELLYAKTHEWVARRRTQRRRQDRHRRHLGLRRRGADRPGVHRTAQGRPAGEGRRIVRRDRIGQGRQRLVQPRERRGRRGECALGRTTRDVSTTTPTARAGS